MEFPQLTHFTHSRNERERKSERVLREREIEQVREGERVVDR